MNFKSCWKETNQKKKEQPPGNKDKMSVGTKLHRALRRSLGYHQSFSSNSTPFKNYIKKKRIERAKQGERKNKMASRDPMHGGKILICGRQCIFDGNLSVTEREGWWEETGERADYNLKKGSPLESFLDVMRIPVGETTGGLIPGCKNQHVHEPFYHSHQILQGNVWVRPTHPICCTPKSKWDEEVSNIDISIAISTEWGVDAKLYLIYVCRVDWTEERSVCNWGEEKVEIFFPP